MPPVTSPAPAGAHRAAHPSGEHETPALAALRRFELRATAVRALAVVAVIVALGAGLLAWRSRPVVAPLPPLASASNLASPPPATIVVAVAGTVARPGLVTLPAGSRVADAIAAAGGVLPGTDLGTLNLARKVVDGELITVGLPEPVGGQGGAGTGGLVDLNTATIDQLQTLPGVGPVLAQRIVDYRDQHGGFGSVEDLRRVTGIGDARFAELKPLVTV